MVNKNDSCSQGMDPDRCAGGTSYKTREKMKRMILYFIFFSLVEAITASICKLICNVILCCFCHRSTARVLGQRPGSGTAQPAVLQ